MLLSLVDEIFDPKEPKDWKSDLNNYCEKVNGSDKVSNKVKLEVPPEVEEKIRSGGDKYAWRYYARSFTGYLVLCHVRAYLSGKESLFGDIWDPEKKRLANVLAAKHFGVLKMYDIPDTDLELKDYSVDVLDKNRPIITPSMLEKAKIEFPIDFLDRSDQYVKEEEPVVHSNNKEEQQVSSDSSDNDTVEKKESKVNSTVEDSNEIVNKEAEKFNDDSVNVIDIEEAVLKKGQKKSNKKARQAVANLIEMPGPVATETKQSIDNVIDTKFKEADTKSETESKDEVEDNVSETADNKIKPIVNNDNLILNPKEVQPVTEHQKDTFQKCFGEYLGGKKYWLNRLQPGEIECVVRDDEHRIYNRFWIDPGLVVGNGYNVLGRVSGNDTIPVHYTEKEICQKVFNDPAYTLTPEEVHKCMSHMFMNQSIYHYIDMSNMSDRISNSKLSESQFKKLGKKLTYILNSLTPEEKGRIRISAWKSTDNFKLISDNKCRSPFPGQTCTRFTGVAISVKGDSVKITFNGNSRQSIITNYNAL